MIRCQYAQFRYAGDSDLECKINRAKGNTRSSFSRYVCLHNGYIYILSPGLSCFPKDPSEHKTVGSYYTINYYMKYPVTRNRKFGQRPILMAFACKDIYNFV